MLNFVCFFGDIGSVISPPTLSLVLCDLNCHIFFLNYYLCDFLKSWYRGRPGIAEKTCTISGFFRWKYFISVSVVRSTVITFSVIMTWNYHQITDNLITKKNIIKASENLDHFIPGNKIPVRISPNVLISQNFQISAM